MRLSSFLIVLSLSIITFFGCKTKSSGPDPSDFDRTAMLTNWAENIIIPAYTDFSVHMDTLKVRGLRFTANPDQNTFASLREAWSTAYLKWQQVSMFEIGKAAELRYRDNMNIYPVNVDELKENIQQGNYDLSLSSENDRQGFPALDYMLYGLGENNEEAISYFTTHSNASGYKAYLNDLVIRMDSLTNLVLDDWNNGYREEFISNDGNGANASVDMLVNDYIYYFEKALRAGKVGIPAGVFSGTPLTSHIEAYYKRDFSRELLLNAIDASQDFFNGKHYDSEESGASLKSYLDFLNTIKEGTDLSLLINTQFEAATNETMDLDYNFVTQIETDNSALLETYDQLQMNVVLLKVDMLQALNINVDYVDADGD